jgi:hypothetical protein
MDLLTPIPRWFVARQQPLVAAVVAVALLAASLGVPVLIEPERDISRPFPCMHHRCGCGSAEACWHGCCCMTLAQKLAWAKEHGVTPPDYALAQTEHGEHDAVDAPRSCGSCSRREGCELVVAKQKTAGRNVGLVLSEDFRRCNGLASLWLTIGHALPPRVETSAARYQPAPVGWLVETSQSAESLALSPATPPPRHS